MKTNMPIKKQRVEAHLHASHQKAPRGEGRRLKAKGNAFREFRPRSRQKAVPKGHSTIAQRFSVGEPRGGKPCPEGTAESLSDRTSLSRPFGTCSSRRRNPTLKRWAILSVSLRDKDFGEFPKGIEAKGQGPFTLRKSVSEDGRQPAAVDYLASLLCTWLALALLVTGCAGPRPLKGGRGVTTRNPAGAIEQTLVQGENPSQASKQDQESVKVRTYTVPAGSRMEQLNAECGVRSAEGRKAEAVIANAQPSTSFAASRQPSTLNAQPSTSFVLSAPMPVVEREETHAAAELGAAQKDTARELGAKLSSLKGIVWVGVGLFVFGLGSLVYPPLKLIIGSVTTSAALMLGGVALMVLPTLVVGNELLILGVVGLTVGGWFLAHRHGQLKGEVSSLKSKV